MENDFSVTSVKFKNICNCIHYTQSTWEQQLSANWGTNPNCNTPLPDHLFWLAVKHCHVGCTNIAYCTKFAQPLTWACQLSTACTSFAEIDCKSGNSFILKNYFPSSCFVNVCQFVCHLLNYICNFIVELHVGC